MTIYALIDCNNFYVSCERVFNPRLENKPVAVLSNNDGCIISRSDEVKKMGIKMQPYFKVREICNQNNVEILSSNYQLYGDMSKRVMNLLQTLTLKMEIYSIDEAFLDLSHILKDQLTDYALYIKNYIFKCTGLPVSVGIAQTKTLAKLANLIAKKKKIDDTGICILLDNNFDKLLRTVEIEDIWGVGRGLADKIYNLGIYNALDLKNMKDCVLSEFSVVLRRIVHEIRGLSCLQMEEILPKKNIMSSRSFGKKVTLLPELEEAIAEYVFTAAEKLRIQKSLCRAIYVTLRTDKYKSFGEQYNFSMVEALPFPTSDTTELIKSAKIALKKLYRKGLEYKKAGIILLDITSEANTQINMFTADKSAKHNIIMKLIDNINYSQGKKTIFFAAQGIKQNWKLKCEKRSPLYTTSWAEIPYVK